MIWRPLSWEPYAACTRCGAAASAPCTNLRPDSRRGDERLRPHPARPRLVPAKGGRPLDPDQREDRLIVWRRLASRGVSIADIAHQLGMRRAALDRFILRARQAGHPDAVYHLNGLPNGGRRRRDSSRRQCGT